MLRLVGAFVLAATLACSGSGATRPGKNDGGGNTPPAPGADRRCDAIRDRVRTLYAAGAAEDIDADVDIVLADCRAQPDTVIPCVGKVQTAAELTATCLLPLDENGRVEGKQFGGQ
jgi:hypothetical protein